MSFNKQGTSHKTLYGGVCSILVYMLLLVYFIVLAVRIINHSNDQNNSINLFEDFTDEGVTIPYKTMGSVIFFTLYKSDFLGKSLNYDDNMKKYLSFDSYHSNQNFYKKQGFFKKKLDVHECDEDDFKYDK